MKTTSIFRRDRSLHWNLRNAFRHTGQRIGDCLCKKHCTCDTCPLGWEVRGMEDCDAGCLIYDDLYEGSPCCYLPLFIKRFIRWKTDRKNEKYEARQWEGMAEWYENQEKLDDAMRETLKEMFPGKNFPLNTPLELRRIYEDKCREKGLKLEAVELPKDGFVKKEKEHGKKKRKGKA